MKKKTLIFSFVAAALALALSACGAKPAGIAPEPAPQPGVGPDGNPIGDSPTVDLDPDAGFDAGDLT